jgi:hypothetical protein
MTEQEWLNSIDPRQMLVFLSDNGSERKKRLFACACCRRIWNLLTDERSRTAVEFAECYADGQIDEDDLRQANKESYRAWEDASSVPDDPGEPPDKILYGSSRLWRQKPYEEDPVARRYLSPHRGIAVFHASYAAFMVTVGVIERVVAEGQEAVWFGNDQGQQTMVTAEERTQAGLVRCIFGNPFRPASLSVNSSWLTPSVINLASTTYEERVLSSGELDTIHLAVLADALEDAGSQNVDILTHLRGPGPHVRGCWALDLLLNKE